MLEDKEKRLLLALTAFSVGLLIIRIIYTHTIMHSYLLWNLFLAWLPYVFSKWARKHFIRKNGMIFGALALWLLFLPNTAYIITDFIHLHDDGVMLWFDILLLFAFSLTGLLYGLFSLYIIHTIISKFFTARVSWLMIFTLTGLSGFGIYLGRFLRWNSWDVFVQPYHLLHEFISVINDPYMAKHMFLFSAMLAFFQLFAYGLLYYVKGPVVVEERISFTAYFGSFFSKLSFKRVNYRD